MNIVRQKANLPATPDANLLFCGDCEDYLDHWSEKKTAPFVDLVFTSPPYNLGKAYEEKVALNEYLAWQECVIKKVLRVVKPTGSLVWQVGNFVSNGHICPLDIELAPIFKKFGLKLRNRIIWQFGHGLHCRQRFSGRYEVALWYTVSDRYTFNLDAVRIPSKYPNKKHFKGPKKGQLSGHPHGKNPEDVWIFPVWDNIPNVKSNHVEKTEHPCQFPIGLVERFVLALTDAGDLVLDPFAGVASTACAAALHRRRHHSCEPDYGYCGARTALQVRSFQVRANEDFRKQGLIFFAA